MPAGDDLTVVMFLWSSALAIGLAAITTAGWKHRYLIASLIALAALAGLAGAAWVPAKDIIREGTVGAGIASTLTTVAESWWGWLAVGVVALGATLWRYRQGAWLQLPFLRTVLGPSYIALRGAALGLYERVSRDAPTTARCLTDQEVLRTYASIVLRCDPVRIFGRRPPSREFREIANADYENLFVGPDGNTLQRVVGSEKPIYTDVAILARDYRKYIAKLELDPAEWPIH